MVKGTSFVNLRDAGDPVEAAVAYDRQGADELVLLDITASSDARGIMLDIVSRVAEKIFIPFTVGGGIRTVEDFTQLLRAGADKVSVNSAAIKRPEIINAVSYTHLDVYKRQIQYFNKKQQQTLLEFIENGKITLIASTTENPYFYVYNAILSRSTVFELSLIHI